MAQHDYNIANQTGHAFRDDLNNALLAIATNNSGANSPLPPYNYAYQWYVDTDAPAKLYIDNGSSTYIEVGDLTLDNLGLKKTRRATAQASTSGAAITFSSIPSWANKITMLLNGVSITSASNYELLVQLGTGTSGSPVFVTSGYNSNASSSGTGTSAYNPNGFLLEENGAYSFLRSGTVDMHRIKDNIWVYSSSIKQAANQGSAVVTGVTSNDIGAGNSGDLGAVLTQVRLTTTTADTFDAGTVNIVYES